MSSLAIEYYKKGFAYNEQKNYDAAVLYLNKGEYSFVSTPAHRHSLSVTHHFE